MTWCFQKREEVISGVYFILVLGAARCSLAPKSPSNKVLRRAFSIVWMTLGSNLYCVHWNDKDGSPQDLYEIWLWLQLP